MYSLTRLICSVRFFDGSNSLKILFFCVKLSLIFLFIFFLVNTDLLLEPSNFFLIFLNLLSITKIAIDTNCFKPFFLFFVDFD